MTLWACLHLIGENVLVQRQINNLNCFMNYMVNNNMGRIEKSFSWKYDSDSLCLLYKNNIMSAKRQTN